MVFSQQNERIFSKWIGYCITNIEGVVKFNSENNNVISIAKSSSDFNLLKENLSTVNFKNIVKNEDTAKKYSWDTLLSNFHKKINDGIK